MDQNSLNLFYKSYILPILDYGRLIRGRCSTSNTNRLITLQKGAARIILKVDLMTPSKQMFSELKWLPFPERVKYHTHVVMYKILNILNAKNLAPPTFLQFVLQIEIFFEILKLSITYAYNSIYFKVCPSNLSFVVSSL